MENYPFLTEAVSHVIIRLRKQAGLSQQKLAELSSIARVYLLQLEQGRFRPTLNSVYFMAKGLGIEPHKLVELIEEERKEIEKIANKSAISQSKSSD